MWEVARGIKYVRFEVLDHMCACSITTYLATQRQGLSIQLLAGILTLVSSALHGCSGNARLSKPLTQPFFHEMCKRYWCFSKRYWVTAESPMGADQRFPSGPLQFASGPKGPLGPLWKKGCHLDSTMRSFPCLFFFCFLISLLTPYYWYLKPLQEGRIRTVRFARKAQ